MQPLEIPPLSVAETPAPSQPVLDSAVQGILDVAIGFHRSGRYRDAAQLYEQILKIDPRHADSLHLLGMVAFQAKMHSVAIDLIGRAIAIHGTASYYSNLGTIFQAEKQLDKAEICYARAVELDPNLAEVHLNHGLVLQTQGKLDEAIVAYRKAGELNPGLPEVPCNLGNLLQAQGKAEAAVEHYQRALTLRPDFAEAAYNLGNALQGLNRLEESVLAYERALALNPQLAEAHGNLANILHAQEKPEEAESHFRLALQYKPENPEIHYNLANLLAKQKRHLESIGHFQEALRLDPSLAKAHNNLGNVFRSLDRPEDAVAQYQKIPGNDPAFTDAYNNLGLALLSLGRHEEAAQAIRRTLELKPHLGQAYCNLGAIHHAQNRIAEATEFYERALELTPDLFKARLNLGLIQLGNGDFENGWKTYERRWEDAPLHRRDFSQPQWPPQPDRAEPLNGARILLHAEQGYGDTLQFLRYVPMVQAMGGTVILEVQDRLQRLAAELPGVAQVVRNGDPLPEFDCHCPLLSLPLAFGTSLSNVPAQIPYLTVPAAAQQKAEALDWPKTGLRVGLLWAGNPTFTLDRFRYRSVPLSLFAPLLKEEGKYFFSLQIGEPAAQLTGNLSSVITDLGQLGSDMADTAAQIAHLDLLISADTAVAHLGAALGVPTWILIPYTPDWRWLQDRSDTPWYPNVRLFRQSEPGVWEPVIERMREALTHFSPPADTLTGQGDSRKPYG